MGLMDIFNASKIKAENEILKQRISALGVETYEQTMQKVKAMEQALNATNLEIAQSNSTIARLREEIESLSGTSQSLKKQNDSQARKISRIKELYKSVEYCINNFFEKPVEYSNCKLPPSDS